jgi:hypothetical protein
VTIDSATVTSSSVDFDSGAGLPPVGFAPEKDLVGVDAVLAVDPRNRCTRVAGFLQQSTASAPAGDAGRRPSPFRGNDCLRICVHKSLCGHKFEMPVQGLSSFNNIPAKRR